MAEKTISIAIEDSLVGEVESVLSDLGTDMNTAIKEYLHSIAEKKVNKPFKEPVETLCGKYKGQIWVADDFDDPIEEMKEYME
jgi:hypothetical protein